MLKEFLWGTPQELQADKTIGRLTRRAKLNSQQEAELAEAKGLSRRLFIRRGATTIGATLAVTSPIGAWLVNEALKPPQPQVEQERTYYNGPMDRLSGLEYVPRNSLTEMTTALENTGHPILDKIAKGIRVLYSANIKPREFPEWIDEYSFPFTFVQDTTNTFTTEFQVSQSSGDRVKFIIPSQGVNEPQEGIDKILVGIKLGLRDTPLSGDLLQPAILLAKEYLSLLHSIAFNEEFYDLTKGLYSNVEILDLSGREITDRSQKKAIGRRLLKNNLSEDNNVNWKLLDGFSMLMLGPVLRDLVVAGKIKNYRNIRSIVLAANVVTHSSDEFQSNLRNFMESWRLKNGFTFPLGTGAKSFTEPYFNAVIDLENQIDKAEKG